MRTHSRWPTVAVFFVVAFVSGCVQSPNGESAESSSNGPTANVQSAPVMTVNQLMHGILFPLGNTVFFAQADDPAAISRDPMPSIFAESVDRSLRRLAGRREQRSRAGRVCRSVADPGPHVLERRNRECRRRRLDPLRRRLPRQEHGGVRGSSHEESGRDGRCERGSFGILLGVPPRLSARADARRRDAALHSGPAGSASLSASLGTCPRTSRRSTRRCLLFAR